MPNDRLLGPLMVDIQGLKLCQEDREILSHPLVGGLILFSRNYESPEQLSALICEIRDCAKDIIIAVDHEGGRVQRFRSGFSHLPPMAEFGIHYRVNPEQSLSLAKEMGWLMAAELLSFDIDISFAPVMDREYGVSTIIGDRAFSDNAKEIILLSTAFIEGMHEAGMCSTGKHFPGHGYVAADSHIDIPVDPRSEEEIMAQDMCIFAEMVNKGMDAVMPAHVIYSEVDSQPAGFSSYWVKSILRERLGFDGVVFSDDLSMEGASVAGSFSDRAHAALDAGCDMVLVCNDREAAKEVIAALESIEISRESSRRINKLRGRTSFDSLVSLQQNLRWIDANKKTTSYKEKGATGLWVS